MKPIEVLVNEHLLIEEVLNCLERMAEACAGGADLDGELANDAIGFFRTFVHDWHFPREESYLTRVLPPDDASEIGPPPRFHDHQLCRDHLCAMEQAATAYSEGDHRAVKRFVEHAHAYVGVLMKHIEDEEVRVFPAVPGDPADEESAEAILTPCDSDSPRVDSRALKACVETAHRLADRFNVPRTAVCDGAGPQ